MFRVSESLSSGEICGYRVTPNGFNASGLRRKLTGHVTEAQGRT